MSDVITWLAIVLGLFVASALTINVVRLVDALVARWIKKIRDDSK